ncbi:MAG TPA: ferrous iron transport protein B [Candidatus Kapabacteria bacterium]|nr:ferrous iron transport protein B [Candidatus Kapabacteria bacterium]
MNKVYKAVLIGQSNSGKSTLFKVLSDIKVLSSGPTVEVNSTDVNLYGDTLRLIDLPGLFSLNYIHPAEEITVKFLLHQKIDLIINVVDASMLTRSLELTIELLELGIPMIVALNLEDVANNQGHIIDAEKLSKLLKVPVVPTQALFGKGAKLLLDEIKNLLSNNAKHEQTFFKFTHHLEEEIKKVEKEIRNHINGNEVSSRFYAIKTIENPSIISKTIFEHVENTQREVLENLQKEHNMDGFECISYERHHLAMKISEQVCIIKPTRKTPLINKIDNLLLHPIYGYFFLTAFFFIYFFLVFIVGEFLASLTEAPLSSLANEVEQLKSVNLFLYVSLHGAVQGFIGIVGIVLPYFIPLVLLTAIFEETGYLSRVAFLIDGLMHKIGLHGKSVVPIILGFGCSVPAIYATRMIENPRDRMITAVLIPFVPCSARIAVIFALSAAFTGPFWAVVVFAYVIFILALHGKVMSKFLSKPTGLILDIPRLQRPSLRGSMKATWLRTKDFLKEASIFLLLGSIVLSWLEYFHFAEYLNILFAPILTAILGLPEQLGSTLIFGFLRKELILVMANQALGVNFISELPLNIIQVVSFIIFVTFYFPCLTTFVVILKEFGTKVVVFSAILSVLVATISAYLFKVVLGFIFIGL